MKLFENALNLIYPRVCCICEKICNEGICKKCYLKIVKSIKNNVDDYTKDIDKNFNNHMYIFKYEGLIREKIIDYKFNEKAYLNELFVKIILKNEKIYSFLKKYDIIIPVPIHKQRKRYRGYNQSELILKKLADYMPDILLNTNILYKTKNIKPQSTLNMSKRKENIKNAYTVKNNKLIKDKNILLFDDIYTTGSTVNECSKLLKRSGAKEIGILTIAKD